MSLFTLTHFEHLCLNVSEFTLLLTTTSIENTSCCQNYFISRVSQVYC